MNIRILTDRDTDIAATLGAQLVELQQVFTARLDPAPPPAVNIVFEGFDHPTDMASIRRWRQSGCRLVLLVTEMPSRVSEHGLLWNYIADSRGHPVENYWTERAAKFPEAAQYCDAAWCLVTGSASKIRHWYPNAVDIELGYAKALERFEESRLDYDLCFYGQSTSHRLATVGRLRRAGLSVLTNWDKWGDQRRDAMVRSARVVLDLNQSEYWPIVSTSRIGAALHAGRPVVVEARKIGSPQVERWKHIVRIVDEGESLIEVVSAVTKNWRREYDRQMTAFRQLNGQRSGLAAALAALPKTLPPVLDQEKPAETARIAEERPDRSAPHLVSAWRGNNIVQYGNRIFVVPQSLGPVDLDKMDLSKLNSVRVFGDYASARRAVMG